jgi:hypothetical protein
MEYTFAKTMLSKMKAKRIGPRDVATKVGWSFEHIRKLCNSEAFPSRPLQKALAELLEIDSTEFDQQITIDRWQKKYGRIPPPGQPKHPISAVWDELTGDQQTTLLCVARCLLRQKKSRAA